MQESVLGWYLRACPVCHADLHDDPEAAGWVVCFMCSRTFPASRIVAANEADSSPDESDESTMEPAARKTQKTA